MTQSRSESTAWSFGQFCASCTGSARDFQFYGSASK